MGLFEGLPFRGTKKTLYLVMCAESGHAKVLRVVRRNDMWQLAMKPYLVKKPVMAKVIEFYVPENFRSASKSVSAMKPGRVIEFRLPARKSA